MIDQTTFWIQIPTISEKQSSFEKKSQIRLNKQFRKSCGQIILNNFQTIHIPNESKQTSLSKQQINLSKMFAVLKWKNNTHCKQLHEKIKQENKKISALETYKSKIKISRQYCSQNIDNEFVKSKISDNSLKLRQSTNSFQCFPKKQHFRVDKFVKKPTIHEKTHDFLIKSKVVKKNMKRNRIMSQQNFQMDSNLIVLGNQPRWSQFQSSKYQKGRFKKSNQNYIA